MVQKSCRRRRFCRRRRRRVSHFHRRSPPSTPRRARHHRPCALHPTAWSLCRASTTKPRSPPCSRSRSPNPARAAVNKVAYSCYTYCDPYCSCKLMLIIIIIIIIIICQVGPSPPPRIRTPHSGPASGRRRAVVGAPQSMQQLWTVLQHDGPNHLGFLSIRRYERDGGVLAVGEAAVPLRPPLPFTRRFGRDGEGGVGSMKVSLTAILVGGDRQPSPDGGIRARLACEHDPRAGGAARSDTLCFRCFPVLRRCLCLAFPLPSCPRRCLCPCRFRCFPA